MATAISSTTMLGASPQLTALIAAVDLRREAVENHQREFLDQSAPTEEAPASMSQAVQDNNALNEIWCEAIDAVALFPVTTVGDLAHKLAFMIEHQMGNGMDWLPELLADARTLAKMEG